MQRLSGNLSSQLALYPHDVLGVRVLPQGSSGLGLDRGQRPAGVPAVAVQLLDEGLGARDARLGNGEVRAGDDTLQALCLG